MPKLKINFFGEIQRLSISNLLAHEYLNLLSKAKDDLEALFQSAEFFDWATSLTFQTQYEGITTHHRNVVEIWFNRKRVERLFADQLLGNKLLFPLHRIDIRPLIVYHEPNLIFQQEYFTGLYACFAAEIDVFKLDELSFNLIKPNQDHELAIIETVSYAGGILRRSGGDAVLRGQHYFL